MSKEMLILPSPPPHVDTCRNAASDKVQHEILHGVIVKPLLIRHPVLKKHIFKYFP